MYQNENVVVVEESKVSMVAFRFAAAEYTSMFVKFVNSLGIYKVKSDQRDAYESGEVSFRFAEMDDADAQTAEEKHKAAVIAMRKLFDVNRMFQKAHKGEHIIPYVAEDDYESVLDEIIDRLHV